MCLFYPVVLCGPLRPNSSHRCKVPFSISNYSKKRSPISKQSALEAVHVNIVWSSRKWVPTATGPGRNNVRSDVTLSEKILVVGEARCVQDLLPFCSFPFKMSIKRSLVLFALVAVLFVALTEAADG